MALGFQLLPQEDKFYDLLGESGELAYVCVRLLREIVLETDFDRILKLSNDLQDAKKRAKKVTLEITEKLCQTFVTPLDREDIYALSHVLYKIPKTTEKAMERIVTFRLRPFYDDLPRLTHNMLEAAELLQYLLRNLKNLKESQVVSEKCSQINNIEGDTDDMLSQLLVDLFEKESDVKQVILRKDLYNLMEKVVDRHRDVSKIILEIILKHS